MTVLAKEPDHYAVLGVRPNATALEIRKAFQAIARLHHPDVTGGDAEVLASVTASYSVLKDESKRRVYNVRRVSFLKRCAVCEGVGSVKTMRGFSVTVKTCETCRGEGRI